MRAVVTGANGFVGSALCRKIVEHGDEVIAIVRSEHSDLSRIHDLKNCKIIFCEMSEYTLLPEKLSGESVDVFYHMAWTGSAGPMRGDEKIQIRNVSNSCEAIYAAKKMGCKRFVLAGSIMEFEIQKLMATHRNVGINTLYSTAKHTADYMMRTLADSMEISFVTGIISNIYGPGEKSPRLVNTTIRKLLKGEHCSFSPGEQIYDFIYIDDAAEAFYQLKNDRLPGKYYYIGTESPKPLKEFLMELRDVVSPESELGLGDIKFDGVTLEYTEFDVHGLYKDTKFVRKTSFSEGIRRTADWIESEEL